MTYQNWVMLALSVMSEDKGPDEEWNDVTEVAMSYANDVCGMLWALSTLFDMPIEWAHHSIDEAMEKLFSDIGYEEYIPDTTDMWGSLV